MKVQFISCDFSGGGAAMTSDDRPRKPEERKCATCGEFMTLARITPRLGGLRELRTFQCVNCGSVQTFEQE